MKSVIRWSIRNKPAMNTLMVCILLVGSICLYFIRREVFPVFNLDIIVVNISYPGANPDEIENGICQKAEEAFHQIVGIKKMWTVCQEGCGLIVMELDTSSDPQRVLNEVRSETDRIKSFFPEEAENPVVQQVVLRLPVINIGVLGPRPLNGVAQNAEEEIRHRAIAEEVYEDLRLICSQISMIGVKNYEIAVEIPETSLRKYGLSLESVADTIRRENLELPGGRMKAASQEVLMRGKNKHYTGAEIAQIPVIASLEGEVITIMDIGHVHDAFSDETAKHWVNGQPAISIAVQKTEKEDMIALKDQIENYILQKNLPAGYEIITWMDYSVMVRDRLEMLTENGITGLILVLVILALFLDLRLAFWVTLGIPISMLGACIVLFFMGYSLNMISMFAFLMALGIIVDDSIVIGENVYVHLQRGKTLYEATVDGAAEVIPSVVASVSTTIIAFMPLFFIPGVLGKFIFLLPVGLIAMLCFSIFEALFILPCHLAHDVEERPGWNLNMCSTANSRGRIGLKENVNFSDSEERLNNAENRKSPAGSEEMLSRDGLNLPEDKKVPFISSFFAGLVYGASLMVKRLFLWLKSITDLMNHGVNWCLAWFTDFCYIPVLKMALNYPVCVLACAVSVMVLFAGMYRSGAFIYDTFPEEDSMLLMGYIKYSDGTPAWMTESAVKRMEQAFYEINSSWAQRGTPLGKLAHCSVGHYPEKTDPSGVDESGSHIGGVAIELTDSKNRPFTSKQIAGMWRKAAGDFPEAQRITFSSADNGPAGAAIQFKLTAPRGEMAMLEEAVELAKKRLCQYEGVYDINDDSYPGKYEYQIKIKDNARALGVTLSQIASTVRASYYGAEAMRIQRGRYEVKILVRYPSEERARIENFEKIHIRLNDGSELPLSELAEITLARGYSTITRFWQRRSITVSAEVDLQVTTGTEVCTDLARNFFPELILKKDAQGNQPFKNIGIYWEGQSEISEEATGALTLGFLCSLFCVYVLLTFEFKSYFQPLIIISIIPFSALGMCVGHIIMDIPISMISLFGFVTLAGVVVNDSIVLMDFMNKRYRQDGLTLYDALLSAGRQRLRPVLITSITTVAGLAPILFETSYQAKFIIPMAVTICFGLINSTLLVLFLTPVFYMLHAQIMDKSRS